VPALYGDPVTVAREIASLDHVSKGRGAWNIITSQHPHSLAVLGLDAELPRSAKYDKADEFVTIVTQLWDSLPPAATSASTTTPPQRRHDLPGKHQVFGAYELRGTRPPIGVYF
jgi:alkanesulfonate monooxygenase SsuD/methylene tetrahydromethanopterin reductase-like flavin-dependent oxidoreductase (luciferase family)